MADLDLQSALQMFKSGMQDLSFQRALGSANDQVQQIKASELNDQQQRAALQNVSNQLTMHMAASGVPATTMAQVSGAVGPKHFANSNEMMREGLLTGDTGLQGMAKQEQQFDFDLADKMALAAAKRDPMHQWMMKNKIDEEFTKHTTDMNNKIDPNTSRFGNISKLQGVNNQIRDVMPLLNDPKAWTPTALNESVRKLDSVLSQGAATVSGSEHLTPKFRAKYQAEIQQMASNKPEPMAGADAWQKYYKDVFTRIGDINSGTIKEGQLDYVRGQLPALLNQFPDRKDLIETALQNKIGEPVVIDPKTKDIDLAANVEKQDTYAQVLKEASQNPNDPRSQQALSLISDDDRNLRRTMLRHPDLRSAIAKLKANKK